MEILQLQYLKWNNKVCVKQNTNNKSAYHLIYMTKSQPHHLPNYIGQL